MKSLNLSAKGEGSFRNKAVAPKQRQNKALHPIAYKLHSGRSYLQLSLGLVVDGLNDHASNFLFPRAEQRSAHANHRRAFFNGDFKIV